MGEACGATGRVDWQRHGVPQYASFVVLRGSLAASKGEEGWIEAAHSLPLHLLHCRPDHVLELALVGCRGREERVWEGKGQQVSEWCGK